MIDFIFVPAVIAICVYGFYKVVEVFVHRKERLLMIEKISEISAESKINMEKIFSSNNDGSRFIALRFGSVFAGIGIGLLVGFFITRFANGEQILNTHFDLNIRDTVALIYGACSLTFGGIALLICFVLEQKYRKETK